MATYQLCVNSPLPDFNSLRNSIRGILEIPPLELPKLPRPFLSIPAFVLPTIPDPIFPSFSSWEIEWDKVVSGLQFTQLSQALLGLFTPVLNFLGMSLNSVIPKIPYINISLVDLASGSFNVKAIIENMKGLGQEALSALCSLVGFQYPFYFNLSFPDLEFQTLLELLVRDHFGVCANILFNLVNEVADELEVASLSMPTVPTMASLVSTFVTPKIEALHQSLGSLGKVQIESLFSDILSSFNVPGFSFSKLIPVPFYNHLSIPDIELKEIIKNLYANLVTAPFQILMDFIENTLQLSVSIPLLCIPITIPSIPNLALPNLPSLPEVPSIA